MLTIARLSLDDPLTITEEVGDAITNEGGATVPAARVPLTRALSLATFAPTGSSDLVADRLRLRRQLRSLLNNTPYKLQGLYVLWDQDTENSGWYIPDKIVLADGQDPSSLATGFFKAEGNWNQVGHLRTHRRAVAVYLRDVRLSTTPRDYYRTLNSTDFAGLTPLALTFLPAGVSDVFNTVAAAVVQPFALPRTSWDGGTEFQAVGQTDLAQLSFDQAEASRNVGDVLIYDRRGSITAGTSATPDAAWEEVYGPDYPLLQPSTDVPVLQNGQCRVRFDSGNTPGFKIDLWTGGGGQWSEQGKFTLLRDGDTSGTVDTLVSASVLEYSPHRAVIQAVMRRAADGNSRERVVITLQRGWDGPRVEVYCAPKSTGVTAGMELLYAPVVLDTNTSVSKIDAAGAGAIISTAAIGNFTGGNVGASTFTGENEFTMLRQGAAFHPTVALLQANASTWAGSGSQAYGSTRNLLWPTIGPASTGMLIVQFGFYAGQADQIMEGESMTLGTGTTSVADAAASSGNTAQATRTADTTPHVSRATWPNSAKGKYRVYARVKTSASTLNLFAKTGATTGATKTTTSGSYVWIDLGDIIADGGTLEIHAWATAAATFSVDRVEAVKLEDRTATVPTYDGARDTGQAALYDSRSRDTRVTR